MAANDNDFAPESARAHFPGEPLVDQLPFAAQFIIWAVRTWVTAFKQQRGLDREAIDGFARFNLQQSAMALDEVMSVVAVSAERMIDIRCIKCRMVSADEVILVNAVAAVQAGTQFLAHAGLRQWLPPAAARNVLPALVALGELLAVAGLRAKSIGGAAIPKEADAVDAAPKPSNVTSIGAPGLHLVH